MATAGDGWGPSRRLVHKSRRMSKMPVHPSAEAAWLGTPPTQVEAGGRQSEPPKSAVPCTRTSGAAVTGDLFGAGAPVMGGLFGASAPATGSLRTLSSIRSAPSSTATAVSPAAGTSTALSLCDELVALRNSSAIKDIRRLQQALTDIVVQGREDGCNSSDPTTLQVFHDRSHLFRADTIYL